MKTPNKQTLKVRVGTIEHILLLMNERIKRLEGVVTKDDE
jgi:predicted metalloprotease